MQSSGMSGEYRRGYGRGREAGDVSKKVHSNLIDGEIQNWLCQIKSSDSLGLYSRVKEIWRELISVRGNFMPL